MKKQLPSKREIVPASPDSAPKPRATFTDEFKRESVSRLRAGGQSPAGLGGELGIRRNQLYKWPKKLDEQSSDPPTNAWNLKTYQNT
jgi:transposase